MKVVTLFFTSWNRIDHGSDTLTDFDSGLNRLPLLAPAPLGNVAALLGTEKPLTGSRC
jgi:hypothetical protein